MIRPQPARWFEAVCAREDAFALLELLAGTGHAQIEWCAPDARAKDEAALAALHAWLREAAPWIERAQAAELQHAQLDIARRAFEALTAADLDPARFAALDGLVQSRILVLPAGIALDVPPDVLVARVDAGDEWLAVVLGPAAAVADVEREATAIRGRSIPLPRDLGRTPQEAAIAAGARAAQAQRAAAEARAELAGIASRHGVSLALGDVARAAWCFSNVGAIAPEGVLARVTGWTDDAPVLQGAVEASGTRALMAFPAAPAHARPPLLLRNPRWARPFEIFTRLFGIPGRAGVDPTVLLAIVTPLMFGYMFGDVGQGAVLLAAGLALRRRHPALRLLVPGGIAAIAFGLAFGSVFGREDLLPALWIEPLAAPLAILAVPVAAGALFLATGLALAALQAAWRRQFDAWVRKDAGIAILYAGAMIAAFRPEGLAVAAAGAAWHVAGNLLEAREASAAGAALGSLLERAFQLLVNTLSFARVGAFALAHAGLALAVLGLAEAAGGGAAGFATLVAGNAVVIALEGLVVGIQTTRLVLFEFFIRFYEARGREFTPLAPPLPTEDHA